MPSRNAKNSSISSISLVVKSGDTVYQGNAAFYDLSGDYLTASPSANSVYVGIIGLVFGESLVGDGTKVAPVILAPELQAQWFVNDTGTAVTPADLFTDCYFKDGVTVTKATTAGYPVAGKVLKVSAADGVLVATAPIPGARLAQSIASLAFAANALAPAAVTNGAIYDVPATAGVSTITLPAATQEGTIIYFAADGTKNGHTVQYIDATGPTNLTTALTASKRHLVTCAFRGGKWFANAYVSP